MMECICLTNSYIQSVKVKGEFHRNQNSYYAHCFKEFIIKSKYSFFCCDREKVGQLISILRNSTYLSWLESNCNNMIF